MSLLSTSFDNKRVYWSKLALVKMVCYSKIKSEVGMHFCVIKSKTIKIFVAMVLVMILLAVSFNGSSSAQVFFGYSTRKVPIYNVETEQKQVAISFDAAWGADKTQGILDILKEFEVNATFFLVGFWVEAYPDLTKEIHERGFEIGTHSQTHPNLPKLSEAGIREELTKSISLITAQTGVPVTLFRAPFGDYDNKLITICEDMGIKTIQWDVDTLDWKGLSGEQIALRVEKGVREGSIILCHNNSKHITEALPLIINMLTAKGYGFCTVGELIYQDNYIIDHTGRQKPNTL